MTFGKELKRLRNSRSLTVKKLVEEFKEKFDIRVHKSSITAWERDSIVPTESKLKLYEQYFKVNLQTSYKKAKLHYQAKQEIIKKKKELEDGNYEIFKDVKGNDENF